MAEISYKQLKAAVADVAHQTHRSHEAITARAQRIDAIAADTGRVAEQIASLNVDPYTVAETREVAAITAGLSKAVIAYATQADTTARAAQAAHDQAHASHDGIHEAVNRSGVAGIHDVNAIWLTQE